MYTRRHIPVLFVLSLLLLLSACYRDKVYHIVSKPGSFNSLHHTVTGLNVRLQNAAQLERTRIVEPLGVNAVDMNRDGLIDLIFCGLYDVKIFYNEGQYKFKDVTISSGLASAVNSYKNGGIEVADVNGDGWPDIYVCKQGNPLDSTFDGNMLYINNNGVFIETAAAYSLNLKGYSRDALFFDYDNDSDLDLLVAYWPYDANGKLVKSLNFSFDFYTIPDSTGNKHPHLYENTQDGFVDVTIKAGLSHYNSFTNNVSVSDLNSDGYMDIFVGNDFIGRDYMYLNNGDKTFTEIARDALDQTCMGAMGVDIADVNNDLTPDIYIAEMLPTDKNRQKLSFTPYSIDFYNSYKKYSSISQYQKNFLFVNRNGKVFSEAGFLSNTFATDWSWSPLLADFDNDGNRDLFVSSGIGIDIFNVDFIKGIYGKDVYSSSDNVSISMDMKGHLSKKELEKKLALNLKNNIFRNTGLLGFENVSNEWGLTDSLNSFGAAYADLDNDGDLDLITNNLNGYPRIYLNNLDAGNYVRFKLTGAGKNTAAIGAKVYIYYEGKAQVCEVASKHGFISSSESVAHFGVGKANAIDSVRIEWPGGGIRMLYNQATNKLIAVVQHETETKPVVLDKPKQQPWFSEISRKVGVDYEHKESAFIDYKRDRLIPRKVSREGPGLAVADVNGDKLDDFYITGAAGQAGALYLQTATGFKQSTGQDMYLFTDAEETSAVFFDADADGDMDLYITSASNEFKANSPQLRNRLFFNNGKGVFRYDSLALPVIQTATHAIAPYDYDNDGDIDLFVGGRIEPGLYPLPPQSYLLENDGKGKFSDVTSVKAAESRKAGLYTGAVWADLDGDKKAELITCGEWMGIGIYSYNGNRLVDVTGTYINDDTRGWWNNVKAADIDGDGDIDLLAGNLGENTIFKASVKEPVTILSKDFDGNKTNDPVVFRYIQGINTVFANRDVFCEAMPYFNNRYYNYATFAGTTFDDIFTDKEREGAYMRQITELRSCVFINNGTGKLKKVALPSEAQISTCNDFVVRDVNNDSIPDILIAGNSDCGYFEYGNYQAMKGLVLTGTGNGNFKPVQFTTTGYYVPGFASSLGALYHKGLNKQLYIVGNDNGKAQMFEQLPNNTITGTK